MSNYRQKPVDFLRQFLGIKEGSTQHKTIIDIFNNSGLCKRYKMTLNDSWCATAVSSAFIATGLQSIFPCIECSCENMITLAKQAKIWVENDAFVPSTGDVILYDWNDNGIGDCTGWSDHVGIVVTVSGGNITVIEGNKSDTVAYRNIKVNGQYIRGFITPQYPTEPPQTATEDANGADIETIARDVIRGKYGTGEDRKKALGSLYNVVQQRVNEILKSGDGKEEMTQKTETDIEQIARDVINGKYGNGEQRKKALGNLFEIVQKKVNEILKK